jgi:hypothetical protein
MKRFLMLVAVATVAGAMYVAAAPGSQQTTGPTAAQFATLKRQVASLTKKLKVLTADETKVKKLALDTGGFIVGCFLTQTAGVEGVSQFGDPAGTYGFSYAAAPTGTPGLANSYRTGLDLDASATPHDFLQTVDPSCVSTSTAASPAASQSVLGLRILRAEHVR